MTKAKESREIDEAVNLLRKMKAKEKDGQAWLGELLPGEIVWWAAAVYPSRFSLWMVNGSYLKKQIQIKEEKFSPISLLIW